ncbi:MAG: hypothetical protein P4L10_12555, partial [Acidobacteriaceae bacterium]|nr:hypothetical protein [Acidobacteriaceae bacterium]
QVEQTGAVLNYLRDKFTSDQLYLWMQKETLALYHQMYELALHTARQAEHAFHFERACVQRKFLPCDTWDTLYNGLLAGDRLLLSLRQMEKAYLDENVREYELTKHISLRLMFPGDFLRLRTTGVCDIEIPEWMYDLDYPGHYFRQVRSITVTLPFVTGPYSGVHCTLTMLSSEIRCNPTLRSPAHRCCCEHARRNDYEPCPCDPRFVRYYGARESIATSSGQNDGGIFDQNIQDRYHPFEYSGAICRLRIEIPPENNYFDLDTLSDAVININYTAKPGGPALRAAAREAARDRLPGSGWTFFDVRRDYPDAWRLFTSDQLKEDREKELILEIRRNLFPYLPGKPGIFVSDLSLVFEPEGHCERDCMTTRLWVSDNRTTHRREEAKERDAEEIRCVSHAKWREMFSGSGRLHLEVHEDPRDHRRLHLRFQECAGKLRNVFLFCRYQTHAPEGYEKDRCCEPRERHCAKDRRD